MRLDDWHRIESVVKWTGLTVNSFARNINKSGESLYQIKKGNYGISKELAEAIVAKYPEISRAWLLTGEGDMFTGGSAERVAIPCYEADVLKIAVQEVLPRPAYLISMPTAQGASLAALSLHPAMAPAIPVGAMVILKEAGVDEIVPGNPYLVSSPRVTALRTVRREPGSDTLRLVAAAPEYDDMLLDACEVKKLWAIIGYMYNY
jgi:hypothetical protein